MCQLSKAKDENQWKISLWEPSKGAPPDFRGPTLLLLTVVLLRALRFLPTLPLPGRGIDAERQKQIERVTEMDTKKKKKKKTSYFKL